MDHLSRQERVECSAKKLVGDIPVAKDWKLENISVVAIARDPETLRVLGAARMAWKDLTAPKK